MLRRKSIKFNEHTGRRLVWLPYIVVKSVWEKIKVKQYVRVTAEPTEDNDHSTTIYFDAVVDLRGAIIGRQMMFAFQVDTKDRARVSRPFVIDINGRTNFGDGFTSSNQQYGDSDIRGKAIQRGTLFRLWGDGYDESFRIVETLPLVSET